MDHMMPEMDGIEAVRLIRGLPTDYARDIPIIALTANALTGYDKMFLDNGFQDFVSKPIVIDQLDAVLRRWVGINDRPLYEAVFTGLDREKALERFDGDENVLIGILRSYDSGTGRSVSELDAFLNDGNLRDYAIAVHGMKGASFGICANEIGNLAETLEHAARAGDIKTVKAGHTELKEKIYILQTEIKTVLNRIDVSKPEAGKPDAKLLTELRIACEGFDMDGVDTAMDKLEVYRYSQDGGLLNLLRENVDNMDFEGIAKLLSDYGKE
jgi:CheY-like chemotaxis protein